MNKAKEDHPGAASPATNESILTNQEFHPTLYAQNSDQPHVEYPSFNAAVDEFFSTLESQKIDVKTFQREKEATKKLENVRKDHDQRLKTLEELQEVDRHKAELITRNQQLVDGAILAVQSELARQKSWDEVGLLVKEAQGRGDPVARSIEQLKLEINHVALRLEDPYGDGEIPGMVVDVDLALTAFANATRLVVGEGFFVWGC